MKKLFLLLLSSALLFGLVGCSANSEEDKSGSIAGTSSATTAFTTDEEITEEKSDIDLMFDVRGWLVGDIWNKGFCDLSFYYATGKSSTGEQMDVEFTLRNLKKAYEKKADYDEIINKLPDEYQDIKYSYSKISEQIELLYADVTSRGTEVTGKSLETGLYNQYFETFDDLLYKLDNN